MFCTIESNYTLTGNIRKAGWLERMLVSIAILLGMFLPVLSAYPQECHKDSIIDNFINGKLILINDLSIVNTNDAFFDKLLSLEFTACVEIGPEEGKEFYGSLGKNGVINITLFDVEPLRGEYVDLLDAGILKYFNEESGLFYHTNGVPHLEMYSALNALVNKKIEKVDVIQKEEAMALWGNQAGNGAIMVTVKPNASLTLFDP